MLTYHPGEVHCWSVTNPADPHFSRYHWQGPLRHRNTTEKGKDSIGHTYVDDGEL